MCSVVYTMIIFDAINWPEVSLSWYEYSFRYWLTVTLVGLLVTMARVSLGVHYPSDCMVGFILGVGIGLIGNSAGGLLTQTCGLCVEADCGEHSQSLIYHHAGWRSFTAVTLVSIILVKILSSPPLSVWPKIAHIYGVRADYNITTPHDVAFIMCFQNLFTLLTFYYAFLIFHLLLVAIGKTTTAVVAMSCIPRYDAVPEIPQLLCATDEAPRGRLRCDCAGRDGNHRNCKHLWCLLNETKRQFIMGSADLLHSYLHICLHIFVCMEDILMMT